MHKPKSAFRHLRRPSPAMLVAVTALFLALGGASYAAVAIPKNSISNAMLKNNSVGFAKMRNGAIGYKQIKPSSVGVVRIDKQQIQQAIKNTCTTGQAISAITEPGVETCVPTQAAEFDSGTGANVSLTSSTTPATVASYALNGGTSYFVQADPSFQLTPVSGDSTADHVVISCTLAAGPATTATQTRSVSVDLPAFASNPNTDYVSLPLTVTAPLNTNSETANLTCTRTVSSGDTPTVTAQGTVYALQTSTNTSAKASIAR